MHELLYERLIPKTTYTGYTMSRETALKVYGNKLMYYTKGKMTCWVSFIAFFKRTIFEAEP